MGDELTIEQRCDTQPLVDNHHRVLPTVAYFIIYTSNVRSTSMV